VPSKRDNEIARLNEGLEWNRRIRAASPEERKRMFDSALSTEIKHRHWKTGTHYSKKHGR